MCVVVVVVVDFVALLCFGLLFFALAHFVKRHLNQCVMLVRARRRSHLNRSECRLKLILILELKFAS